MKPNYSGRNSPGLDWKSIPFRHWSPDSEHYAPAEVLLGYLRSGWQLEGRVRVKTVYYSDNRHAEMYIFKLSQGENTIRMPVLGNPAVWRLIVDRDLAIVPLKEATENV